jgi:hypothetical protein
MNGKAGFRFRRPGEGRVFSDPETIFLARQGKGLFPGGQLVDVVPPLAGLGSHSGRDLEGHAEIQPRHLGLSPARVRLDP